MGVLSRLELSIVIVVEPHAQSKQSDKMDSLQKMSESCSVLVELDLQVQMIVLCVGIDWDKLHIDHLVLQAILYTDCVVILDQCHTHLSNTYQMPFHNQNNQQPRGNRVWVW
ncbi:hypothetical protein QVD99_005188 [Batrachochytrium dendrobatidis]|nr:hypothetical protein QVD99_005188 [Batrachochytrium dendrobatidis]